MFEDADNLADLFRGGLPFYILITLPILVICSSNPVLASSEFNVQRMSQYDLHGVPFGMYFDNVLIQQFFLSIEVKLNSLRLQCNSRI